jgi:hypothetical protein
MTGMERHPEQREGSRPQLAQLPVEIVGVNVPLARLAASQMASAVPPSTTYDLPPNVSVGSGCAGAGISQGDGNSCRGSGCRATNQPD